MTTAGGRNPLPADEFVVEVFLVAVRDPVSDQEARRWWNSKESVVDDLVDQCPRLPLGRTDVYSDHPDGPAERVDSLLFLRGTTPVYNLPLLDRVLHEEILAASEPRENDRFPATSVAELRRFLDEHRDSYVITVSADGTG
ncbi:hypothetical protein [Nocardia alni]|uniref:hypothetical protein n=1 Tax=Nocardia alni TaxID=2815723 RepID=UPI001C22452C|nr:hypothetical protein [Nocardia alni]